MHRSLGGRGRVPLALSLDRPLQTGGERVRRTIRRRSGLTDEVLEDGKTLSRWMLEPATYGRWSSAAVDGSVGGSRGASPTVGCTCSRGGPPKGWPRDRPDVGGDCPAPGSRHGADRGGRDEAASDLRATRDRRRPSRARSWKRPCSSRSVAWRSCCGAARISPQTRGSKTRALNDSVASRWTQCSDSEPSRRDHLRRRSCGCNDHLPRSFNVLRRVLRRPRWSPLGSRSQSRLHRRRRRQRTAAGLRSRLTRSRRSMTGRHGLRSRCFRRPGPESSSGRRGSDRRARAAPRRRSLVGGFTRRLRGPQSTFRMCTSPGSRSNSSGSGWAMSSKPRPW